MNVADQAESAAEVLRRAADLIEQRAAKATPGPWTPDAAPEGGWYIDPGPHLDDVGGVDRREDAEWIATLAPQVAGPLAAWLRLTAAGYEQYPLNPGELETSAPVRVARVILGETP